MNDFVTVDTLRDFGAATAGVVAVTNLALMLGGEPARRYAKFVAFFMALVIAFAAQGLPASWPAGVATVLSAVFICLAAMGANGAVTDGLAGRAEAQARDLPGEKGLPAGPARYWRRW